MSSTLHEYEIQEIISIIDSVVDPNDQDIVYEIMKYGTKKITDMRIVEKILEKKVYFLLTYCSGDTILRKVGNTSIFEIMVENSITITQTAFYEIKKLAQAMELIGTSERLAGALGIESTNPYSIIQEAISNLYKKGKIKELSRIREDEILLLKVDDDKTLFEVLLENNVKLRFNGEIVEPEIIKALLRLKKTEYYRKFDPNKVFGQFDDNHTFMDIIMQHKMEDNSINIRIPSTISSIRARIIIEYARYGFKSYIALRRSELFEKNTSTGKNLLDYMLEADREATLNYVLSPASLESPIIKAGIMIHDFKGKVFTAGNIRKRYEEGKLEEYRQMPVTEEQEQLLTRLREVLSDEKSNPQLVEMTVLNYRRLFAQNNPCAYEVQHLIEMKEQDIRFSITTPNPMYGNSYNSFLNEISIDGLNVKAFNHEIGHALFENVSNRYVPEEFVEIIERIRSDESHLEKVHEHSIAYKNAKAVISSEVSVMLDEEFEAYVTGAQVAAIDKKIRELELSNDDIRKMFARYPSISAADYLIKEKEIRRKECENLLLENVYYNLTSISDIIDAIYEGKYIDKKLVYNNRVIIGEWGHGQKYFSYGIDLIFNEILADYSRIIKSPNPQEGIEMLTYYVCEELVDFLHRYYQANILDAAINEFESNYGRENERRFGI